jgi:hypothetical protein
MSLSSSLTEQLRFTQRTPSDGRLPLRRSTTSHREDNRALSTPKCFLILRVARHCCTQIFSNFIVGTISQPRGFARCTSLDAYH